jgi:hypothetical protein
MLQDNNPTIYVLEAKDKTLEYVLKDAAQQPRIMDCHCIH